MLAYILKKVLLKNRFYVFFNKIYSLEDNLVLFFKFLCNDLSMSWKILVIWIWLVLWCHICISTDLPYILKIVFFALLLSTSLMHSFILLCYSWNFVYVYVSFISIIWLFYWFQRFSFWNFELHGLCLEALLSLLLHVMLMLKILDQSDVDMVNFFP